MNIKLEINEQVEVDVDPAKRYQPTQIEVSSGQQYQFNAQGKWRDASEICGPEGWKNWWTGYFLRFSRLPKHDLFFLGGSISQNEDTNFPIGSSASIRVEVTGELFLFANDLWYFYCNNHRVPEQPMRVNIRRIS